MVFGRKIKKVEEDNTPDLVVPAVGRLPKSIGMQGFTEDKPVEEFEDEVIEETDDEPVIAPSYRVKPQQAKVTAPVPDPVAAIIKTKKEPEQYQIIAVELISTGLYRYIIVTNKILGDIGGVYDI